MYLVNCNVFLIFIREKKSLIHLLFTKKIRLQQEFLKTPFRKTWVYISWIFRSELFKIHHSFPLIQPERLQGKNGFGGKFSMIVHQSHKWNASTWRIALNREITILFTDLDECIYTLFYCCAFPWKC